MFQPHSLFRAACIGALLASPISAHAAGGGGDESNTTPPQKTETTKNCFAERQWDPETGRYVRFTQPVNGVWDPNARRCIRPDKAGYLESGLLRDTVRELAYAGRYAEAQQVLAQMDQTDDIVLTYWGFTHRKMGDLTSANAYYTQAISKNPDNILARSYMGQGLVDDGNIAGAREQLREIRVRGGRSTWAEVSLRMALETGQTYSY